MNIAICDDLESDRQALIHMIKKYCNDYNLEIELSNYRNGNELLYNLTSEKFKLIFLDIYMNDENNITDLDNMLFIEVPSNGLSVKLLLKDIYYIEVYNKECLIHTSLQVIKTYNFLKQIYSDYFFEQMRSGE